MKKVKNWWKSVKEKFDSLKFQPAKILSEVERRKVKCHNLLRFFFSSAAAILNGMQKQFPSFKREKSYLKTCYRYMIRINFNGKNGVLLNSNNNTYAYETTKPGNVFLLLIAMARVGCTLFFGRWKNWGNLAPPHLNRSQTSKPTNWSFHGVIPNP